MSASKKQAAQSGFTLIELIVVVLVISIVAAISFKNFYSSSKEVGGAERVLESAAGRVVERRNEAVRLNGENRQALDSVGSNIPPLSIDFSNLANTASLVTEGDDNADCLDDVTGTRVTCLILGINSLWNMAYRPDAMGLPNGWSVAASSSDFGGIPLIGNGSSGRGVLVTQVGFDANGRALGYQSGAGWVKNPAGAVAGGSPSLSAAPFWAIYFVGKRADGSVSAAVAVAVHPSGLVERFRYDGSNWIGFENRSL